ncbi:FAD/NAD(P)-binding domain-containing protein [Setomelanomma holmii]|uniref:FAD/NAD(P)-binding domain-containing protein n=1 Tax=Setomelanomma holmii TaxID=210430 RepID=A0A9P4LMV3_9PLEO|nr:FAD/NAD(P)-binding domain-containing protein [Setomelanomma holmii]
MTVFLDTPSPGLAPSNLFKSPTVTVEAPATEEEIPKIKGVAPSKPTTNSHHTNGVHSNGNTTNGYHDTVQDPFKLASEHAYTPRRLKVFTIGAGFSGLLMAHKFQHRFLDMQEFVDHTIFEAHHEVGGTWLVNNYPGVQCDVPAHIYAFPFDPNPDWTSKVVAAQWHEPEGMWCVEIENTKTQQRREEWHENWPKIPGFESFKGHITHSARWDHDYDYSNKRIAVIGNGSSGIQIVPQMAKLPGTTVQNFIRSGAWVYYRAPPSKHMGREVDDPNPGIVSRTNKSFYIFMRGENNKAGMKAATEQMAEKLGHDKRLCDMLIPKWELGCRRITPGPGYLESFLRDNCDCTNSGITAITENGVQTADEKTFECDGLRANLATVICATGFDVSHRPRYPMIGQNGINLREKWAEDPESYISVMTPDFPNYFMMMGPNCLGGHGSLAESLNWPGDWFVKWIKKIAHEDIKCVTPKQEKTLVWSGGCSSWYRRGRIDRRVTALFGGSAQLFNKMTSNPWRFMGNGFTEFEMKEESDLSWYVGIAEEAQGKGPDKAAVVNSKQ